MAAFEYLNKCALKLKTPELVQEAFESYCKHLASGYPKEAWVFKKDGKPLCMWRGIEAHIDEVVESSVHLGAAEAERYKHWFENVSNSSVGKNTKANPASLQMIMRNMFGWDKESADDRVAKKVEDLAMMRDFLYPKDSKEPKA